MAVEDRIRRAKKMLSQINPDKVKDDLKKLERAIEETWSYMKEIGVNEICKKCAEETGSCCKEWVEDEVDDVMIVMNMLMGVKMPEKRFKEGFCYFLSENGCILKVRPTICVNFLCDKITKTIGFENEKKLQEIAGRELELGFIVREKILKQLSFYFLERNSSKSYRLPSHSREKISST
ncbi:hypothetical protein [Archaeoglobus profundus]|nr:hypothetical protein [Archaeoglobus profundus]